MAGVGGCGGKKHLSFIKTVKLRRIFEEKFVRDNRFGRIGVFLVIQAVLRTEIGYAALRADARASEKHRVPLVDNLFQLPELFFISVHFFSPLSAEKIRARKISAPQFRFSQPALR